MPIAAPTFTKTTSLIRTALSLALAAVLAATASPTLAQDPVVAAVGDSACLEPTLDPSHARTRRRRTSSPPWPRAPSSRSAISSTGITQFTVGTGGRSEYSFSGFEANSLVRGVGYGALRLGLQGDYYDWRFDGTPSTTISDQGAKLCHRAPRPTTRTLRFPATDARSAPPPPRPSPTER